MSHEISTASGRAELAYASGQVPWHSLGVAIPEGATLTEAFRLAALQWSVLGCPLFVQAPSGAMIPVPDHKGNLRLDTEGYLGAVGADYCPVQWDAVRDLAEAMVGESGAKVSCLGALSGGRRIFATLDLNGGVTVGHGDKLKRYIILANSHDGTMSLRAFWSNVRVVCANTWRLAMRDAKDGIALRHTVNVGQRIDDAKRAIGAAKGYFGKLTEASAAMAERHVTDAEVDAFFAAVLPIPKRTLKPDNALSVRRAEESQSFARRAHEEESRRVVAELLKPVGQINAEKVLMHELLGSAPASAAIAGPSAWTLFNGVTAWSNHHRPFRGENATAKAEARFDGLLIGGPTFDTVQRAGELAMDLAGVRS